jgi:prevent-host-death family protein
VDDMKINTQDMISVTEANRRGVSSLVKTASEGRPVVLVRNNEPAAVMVGVETMERLERIEELEEDIRLLAIAWARTLTDSGRRYSLEDVARELGVDLNDED